MIDFKFRVWVYFNGRWGSYGAFETYSRAQEIADYYSSINPERATFIDDYCPNAIGPFAC
jgi:hypothetical protein